MHKTYTSLQDTPTFLIITRLGMYFLHSYFSVDKVENVNEILYIHPIKHACIFNRSFYAVIARKTVVTVGGEK